MSSSQNDKGNIGWLVKLTGNDRINTKAGTHNSRYFSLHKMSSSFCFYPLAPGKQTIGPGRLEAVR